MYLGRKNTIAKQRFQKGEREVERVSITVGGLPTVLEEEPTIQENLLQAVERMIDDRIQLKTPDAINEGVADIFNEYFDNYMTNITKIYNISQAYVAGNGIIIDGDVIRLNIDSDHFQFSSGQLQDKLSNC